MTLLIYTNNSLISVIIKMMCDSVVPDVTPIWTGKQDDLNDNGCKCKHIQPQANMTRQIITQLVRISYSFKNIEYITTVAAVVMIGTV